MEYRPALDDTPRVALRCYMSRVVCSDDISPRCARCHQWHTIPINNFFGLSLERKFRLIGTGFVSFFHLFAVTLASLILYIYICIHHHTNNISGLYTNKERIIRDN